MTATTTRPHRDLDPLSVFFLDVAPARAAELLRDEHISSQCRALGAEVCQIAREVGLDFTGFRRDAGPYPDRGLSTIGLWATESTDNHVWFCLYVLAVFEEHRRRKGQKRFDAKKARSPFHASRAYVTWLWEAMEQQEKVVAGRSEGWSCPPLPCLGDAQALTIPPDAAAKISLKLYERRPVLIDEREIALDRLAYEARRSDWSERWLRALLDRPEDAQRSLPDHPLIRAWTAAEASHPTPEQLRTAVLSHLSADNDRDHTHSRRQRAA